MFEIRCNHCGKLLLKAAAPYEACSEEAHLEIKCGNNKCKKTNNYKTK
ncbi:hypothetical protein [Bacillus ndiopicus]|nr:hypothetical protein [Bacillus ndiopicus]